MKLYLHIGNHKTGSTTIQSNLTKNREILYKKHNILYPKTGLIKGAHHILPSIILGRDKIFNQDIDVNYSTFLQDFKKEIEQYKPESVIISSEMFFIFDEEDIKKLERLIDLFDEVSIIAYLRNQVDHLESTYKFNVLWWGVEEKQTFKAFLLNILKSKYHYYHLRIDNWNKLLPKSSLNLKNFHEEIKKGFLSSFYNNVLDVNFDVTEDKNNISLSRLSTLFLRIKNREEIDRKERDRLIELLQHFDISLDRLLKESIYTQSMYHTVKKYFFESNELLRTNYNIDLNSTIKDISNVNCLGEELSESDLSIFLKYFVDINRNTK